MLLFCFHFCCFSEKMFPLFRHKSTVEWSEKGWRQNENNKTKRKLWDENWTFCDRINRDEISTFVSFVILAFWRTTLLESQLCSVHCTLLTCWSPSAIFQRLRDVNQIFPFFLISYSCHFLGARNESFYPPKFELRKKKIVHREPLSSPRFFEQRKKNCKVLRLKLTLDTKVTWERRRKKISIIFLSSTKSTKQPRKRWKRARSINFPFQWISECALRREAITEYQSWMN